MRRAQRAHGARQGHAQLRRLVAAAQPAAAQPEAAVGEGHAQVALVVFVVLLPLFKPLTVPMWGVLLTVLNYVYWERARKYEPRQVAPGGKLRAGERPIERNWLLRCIVRGTAALLTAAVCQNE